MENEKDKFVDELRAIVCQAQDIISSLPIEERAAGMESAPSDPNNCQVSLASLVMPVFWKDVYLYWETPFLYLSIHF